ncbi:MAG: twin-arginine translocase TatA/TatE family subunit [Pseudomonadota bacterium]
MGGMGASELILIFAIMLVVLGPERMAEVARKIGQFIGYARRVQQNLANQLEDELELKKLTSTLPDRVDIKQELGLDELENDVRKLTHPDPEAADTDDTDSDAADDQTAQADPR